MADGLPQEKKKVGQLVEKVEKWVLIEEFPGYAVSDHGNVLNTSTELLKTPSMNQQGIYSVNFIRDGVQCRRSVSVLVAHTFLEPPVKPTFDTPINLDGDRKNNDVTNLAWRPRWFAVMYHKQLLHPPPYGFRGVVKCIDTGEVFYKIRDLSTKYGLLEKEIILATQNKIPVFPTWQTFQTVL